MAGTPPRNVDTPDTPRRPSAARQRGRVSVREMDSAEKLHVPVSLSKSFGTSGVWSEEEIKALVEFILLMSSGKKWPTHKRVDFWEGAGQFIQRRVKTRHYRTCKYCFWVNNAHNRASFSAIVSHVCTSVMEY